MYFEANCVFLSSSRCSLGAIRMVETKRRRFEAKTQPCGDQTRACVVVEKYGGEDTGVPKKGSVSIKETRPCVNTTRPCGNTTSS